MSSPKVTFNPAWNEVCGFEGVAAEVRDVRTVMDALRTDVSWEVVDCEDGTAEARVVIWDTIPSIDLLFPDPAIPLQSASCNTWATNYLTTTTWSSARRRACSH